LPLLSRRVNARPSGDQRAAPATPCIRSQLSTIRPVTIASPNLRIPRAVGLERYPLFVGRKVRPRTTPLPLTAPTWGKLVAPWAEYVASTLWATTTRSKSIRIPVPATRLTQQHRRQAKGQPSFPSVTPPEPDSVCRGCGTHVNRSRRYCSGCAQTETKANFGVGREIAQRPESLAKRAATQRQHKLAMRNWKRADLPGWLTPDVYEKQIQPALGASRHLESVQP
jgi:hypothetical protein